MNKIAIIIPSRLDAVRFPNKPLKLINNKEMILHVYEAAKKSFAIVRTSDSGPYGCFILKKGVVDLQPI